LFATVDVDVEEEMASSAKDDCKEEEIPNGDVKVWRLLP